TIILPEYLGRGASTAMIGGRAVAWSRVTLIPEPLAEAIRPEGGGSCGRPAPPGRVRPEAGGCRGSAGGRCGPVEDTITVPSVEAALAVFTVESTIAVARRAIPRTWSQSRLCIPPLFPRSCRWGARGSPAAGCDAATVDEVWETSTGGRGTCEPGAGDAAP